LTDSTLIVSDEDLSTIKEVGKLLGSGEVKTTLPFPEFPDDLVMCADTFHAGVLDFNPIDVRGIFAVRSDRRCQRYVDQVRSALQLDSDARRQDVLLEAMREALDRQDRIGRASMVFEILNWIAKPLPLLVGTLIDGMNMYLGREHAKSGWFRFASVASHVAVEDYLRRTGNRGQAGN
jgi:hypothetical protein